MNRQNIIILITVTLLTIIGGSAYWYFVKIAPSTTPDGAFPGESGVRPGDTSVTPVETTPEDTGVFTSPSGAVLPRLYELHKAPVAGVGFVETKGKKGNIVNIATRYIERGLGHIYETQLSTYTESRIVNETRSRIMEALWGNNGKSVVIRFIDDKDGVVIKTRIVNIGDSTISFARGTSTVSLPSNFLRTEEVYLPDNIPFMAVAEDSTDKLFYLEGGVGSTATFKDTSVSKIFSSAFTEWLPQFPNQNLITLTTRPSGAVPGHMFFLNPKTKVVTKILGNINGLTTQTNYDGNLVLYSETKSNTPVLSIYDTSKKEIHSLSLLTLPEKCVWSLKKTTLAYCAVPQAIQSANYPDQWYQGLVSFSDELWEIDATTFNTRRIMTPKTLGAPVLDMINLTLSSDDNFLLFMNKISGNPWVYSIVEPLPPRTVIAPPFSTTTEPVVLSPISTTPTSPKLPNTGIGPDVVKIK